MVLTNCGATFLQADSFKLVYGGTWHRCCVGIGLVSGETLLQEKS